MNLKNRVLSIIFLLLSTLGHSQEVLTIEPSLETPYNTIFTHLYFLQDNNYFPEKSAATIQGNYTQEEKIQIAIKIKKVLDSKGLYIDMKLVPDIENYTDSLVGKAIYVLSPKEKRIYLEKIDSFWYYSKATIDNIDETYKSVNSIWIIVLEKFLPSKISHKSFLNVKIWQYIAFILLGLIAFIFYFIFKRISLLFVNKIALPMFKTRVPKKELLFTIAKSISLVITFWFVGSSIPSLQFPVKYSAILIVVNRILLIYFVAYLIKNLFELFLFYLEKIVAKTDTKLDNQLLPILRKLGKFIIYTTAILYILKELNVNIAALLAGLSVGGLAIALASKDTVQNFIGSLNIFLDRPFEIGDYIVISGTEGEVEEVGLRATRIRTLNQSVAYIPNGVLSNMTIDNFGLRVFRRWRTSFGLDYNTSPEKIELFIKETEEIINKNIHTLNDKTTVKFNNLGASTLDIYVSVFFNVKSFQEDLSCKQEILLDILKMTKENKISFAFPTQTIYTQKA